MSNTYSSARQKVYMSHHNKSAMAVFPEESSEALNYLIADALDEICERHNVQMLRHLGIRNGVFINAVRQSVEFRISQIGFPPRTTSPKDVRVLAFLSLPWSVFADESQDEATINKIVECFEKAVAKLRANDEATEEVDNA